MIEFRFNKIFAPVFTTKERYIDIWGGRARGGSHFGTDYFLHLITKPSYFRGYFVRQTFNDIRDSLFRDFRDRIESNSTINPDEFHIRDNDMRITHLPTGNMILSKGVSKDGSRTAKMKSIAGATHVLMEEFDEIGEDDFNQLDLSLRTTRSEKVQLIRIFNPPPKNHHIWKSYNLTESGIEGFYQAEPKSTAGILSIHSTYLDNIRNIHPSTIAKFEEFKRNNPDYYYNQVMGLISEGARGRIYNGWKPISDIEYNALDLPKVYIVDFGYSEDPTALIEVKWHKQDRYVKELIYESGLDNIALGKRMRDLGIDVTDLIIADMGGGGDLRIAELRRGWQFDDYPDLRFTIRPTIKGQGSINFGISRVKSCNIYMAESSTNGWKEYQEYKWRLDADKLPADTPMDRMNHIMDCIRYFELSHGSLF